MVPVKIRGVAILTLALLSCGGEAVRDSSPQAIVLVSIDALRADYLNLYGFEEYQTSPNLDAFAADAVVFDRAFAVEPWTLTSHMSLFTGLYPHRHGVQLEAPLSVEIPTLAELLRARGYLTHGFIDGGYLKPRWGAERGFDFYVKHHNRGFAVSLPKILDWLRSHRKDRFFLFIHTYDVHSSGPIPLYESPEPTQGLFSSSIRSALKTSDRKEFAKRWAARRRAPSAEDIAFIRASYAEGVRFVDVQLGAIFEELKELGLYESALIVVWSDHGEGLFSQGIWNKAQLFDSTMRIPLLVKLPGPDKPEKRIESPVSSVDLMPTILELAGAEVPDSLDGRSLLPVIRNGEERGIVYFVRTRNDTQWFGARSARYLYLRNEEDGKEYLFDAETDPDQQKNLVRSQTPESRELRRMLRQWIGEQQMAARGQGAERLELDETTRQELRALGYVH